MLNILKRINRLEKELESNIGKLEYIKFIVKTKEGLFLFDLNKDVDEHIEKYAPIADIIPGYYVHDVSEHPLDTILIVGDGKHEPICIIDDYEDLPEEIQESFKKACNKNSSNPYKELTTEELKVLAFMDESKE